MAAGDRIYVTLDAVGDVTVLAEHGIRLQHGPSVTTTLAIPVNDCCQVQVQVQPMVAATMG